MHLDSQMASPSKAFYGKAGDKRREKISAFGKALKSKITDLMPGRTTVVDNKLNPDSAWSKMKRATDAKAKLPPNFSK